MNAFEKFAQLFGARIVHGEWDVLTTHLVVKTCLRGKFVRTAKVGNALLTNCSVVTFDWIEQCSHSHQLQSEVYKYAVKHFE